MKDYGIQSLNPKIILSAYWASCTVELRIVWNIKSPPKYAENMSAPPLYRREGEREKERGGGL